MARTTHCELLRELGATDEAYVRRKLLLGGYSTSQQKIVKGWLLQCERELVDEQVANEAAISNRMIFWTKISAVTAVGVATLSSIGLLITCLNG